eukprot:gb/GECG01010124.1/.p1 GENE.gb/GECG01010124.1/~~gb/GECG01010124.1/.p1  ORF type:complete len:411 (+),score=29.29 gb/GECG01010124.1/:1-1233(+)
MVGVKFPILPLRLIYSLLVCGVLQFLSVFPVAASDTIVVDDFEDSDLSEYDGDKDVFSVASKWTYSGGASLYGNNKGTGSDNDEDWIYSTSGLNAYPERGSTIRVVYKIHDFRTGAWCDPDIEFCFGGQDKDNAYCVRHGVWPDPRTNSVGLFLRRPGKKIAGSGEGSGPTGAGVYSFEIEYGDPTITVRLYEGDWDTLKQEISGDDTAYNSQGIGFTMYHGGCDGGDGWVKVSIDYVHIVPQECGVGKEPNGKGTGCETCSPHEYAGQGGSVCQPCGPGSIPLEDQSDCRPCEAHEYSKKDDNKCHSRDVGHIPLNDQSDCKPCRSYEYSENEDDRCHLCGAGQVPLKDQSGRKSYTDSNYRSCGVGHVPLDDQSDCKSCRPYEYSETKDDKCHSCGVGRILLQCRRSE